MLSPRRVWSSSLRLDVGSKIGGFTARQIHIGHSRMWCRQKIRDRRFVEIWFIRYGRKRWSLRGALLLIRRHDMAGSTPALGKYFALAGVGREHAVRQSSAEDQKKR